MRLGLHALSEVDGLSFLKLLGSGAKNGFSARPNFGTYVLLCVWESESFAQEFFENNPFLRAYRERSTEHFTVYLYSSAAHGHWDGDQPFLSCTSIAADQPVVVVTRARIRLIKLWSFWSKVGKVGDSLKGAKGLLMSIGVGEWPLIQQATISIWSTQAEMLDYAYKSSKHREVIRLTRALKWYKEEMFARFVPYKFDGFWEGRNVEPFMQNDII